MPTSMVIESTPSSSSVVAAFLLFGFLNAGTPLEIASTPVSAAQPEENARSSRKTNAKPVNASALGERSCRSGAGRLQVVAQHEDPEQPADDHARSSRS